MYSLIMCGVNRTENLADYESITHKNPSANLPPSDYYLEMKTLRSRGKKKECKNLMVFYDKSTSTLRLFDGRAV